MSTTGHIEFTRASALYLDTLTWKFEGDLESSSTGNFDVVDGKFVALEDEPPGDDEDLSICMTAGEVRAHIAALRRLAEYLRSYSEALAEAESAGAADRAA